MNEESKAAAVVAPSEEDTLEGVIEIRDPDIDVEAIIDADS